MKIKKSDIENYNPERYHLQKLDVWLSFEIGSSVVFVVYFIIFVAFIPSFLIPFSLVIILVVSAAVIFMPIMLFHLYQLQRFGWFISFFIIITPPLFIDLIFVENNIVEWLLRSYTLASFYFYCFTLKYFVRDRLDDLSRISPTITDLESYSEGF